MRNTRSDSFPCSASDSVDAAGSGVIFTSIPPAPLKGLFFGVRAGSTLKFET
jgi:hypothetical protein